MSNGYCSHGLEILSLQWTGAIIELKSFIFHHSEIHSLLSHDQSPKYYCFICFVFFLSCLRQKGKSSPCYSILIGKRTTHFQNKVSVSLKTNAQTKITLVQMWNIFSNIINDTRITDYSTVNWSRKSSPIYHCELVVPVFVIP